LSPSVKRDSHSVTYPRLTSAPTKGRRDVGENRFDNMCIVGDTQLVRDGQQQRVGLGDGLILLELLDEDVGRGGVAPTKDDGVESWMKPIWSASSPPPPEKARSRSFTTARMLRLTETRGSRA
jgi:hypothetical protein